MALATAGLIANYSLVKIKKLNDFKDRPQAYDATRMIVSSPVTGSRRSRGDPAADISGGAGGPEGGYVFAQKYPGGKLLGRSHTPTPHLFRYWFSRPRKSKFFGVSN